ncbi:iron complex transport system substrate-binding protein [Halpernia frigidisoli]|uniref:Iron complex transport system substrate-binding protein n=1 Tax=Halpernia frigidisoli TaxID=1125876 RepID=A0A1I3EAA7_9FLAO|nr:iron complex transport system substrate-binding protein [Halpernia frigidisoli]
MSQNVSYQKDKKFFSLKSGRFSYQFKNSDLPFKKVILLNSSLLGFIEAINSENNIIAVSSPEYIYSQKIKNLIKSGRIQDVGNEQKFDVEKIISLKPDVIFTNYVPSFENTYNLLRKNSIEIIFFDEYLEQDPLEKSAYVKVFGQLLGKISESEKVFGEVKSNYENLKISALKSIEKPQVLVNEMYGNEWFLAGGKSNLAQFIKDANAKYILEENPESKGIPLSFEEVFVKAKDAKYWVNVSDHLAKKELLQINRSYAKMNVFNMGNLYSVSGKTKSKSNDYFESGVFRADLVLKDYIKIFHPELLPDYNLTYMKKLK